jgi:hypothetical protein
MPELKEVFEMVTKQSEPDLDSWNQQEERHRRTARNRKVGVFVLAAAIAVVAMVFILRADDGTDSTTVGTDATSTPQQIATSFAEAYGAFDADRAITYLADDADISGLMLGPADVEGTETLVRLNLAMLDATGFVQLLGPCEEINRGSPASVVRCPFDFFIADSDYGGQSSAPFTGASYDLSVEGGKITHASVDWAGPLAGLWKDFTDWVSQNHPDDLSSMFADDTYATIRLNERSGSLWRVNLYRYVERPPFPCVPQMPC